MFGYSEAKLRRSTNNANVLSPDFSETGERIGTHEKKLGTFYFLFVDKYLTKTCVGIDHHGFGPFCAWYTQGVVMYINVHLSFFTLLVIIISKVKIS